MATYVPHGIPRKADTVPVDPLRERFLRSGETAAAVARRLGWYDRGHADGPRVLRVLGLKPYWPSNGRPPGTERPPRLRERVTHATAVQMANALGMDPHEVDV